MADALDLARLLVADGVSDAVVTPHVFPGRYENDRARIEEQTKIFVSALEESSIPLNIRWAGEVRMCSESLEWLDAGRLPMLGLCDGYKTMLVEMPDGQVPLGAAKFLRSLLDRRVKPVIVHPERNRAIMERPDKMKPLIEAGCFFQITAGSLVGQFGFKAANLAVELIRSNTVNAIASDSHNLRGRRPMMSDARRFLAERFGTKVAERLTQIEPRRLVGAPAL